MELFNAQHVLHGEPVTGELPSTNSLFKTTINMAWPSMVESFLVALVGFIDTIMVSTLGSYAIAAAEVHRLGAVYVDEHGHLGAGCTA